MTVVDGQWLQNLLLSVSHGDTISVISFAGKRHMEASASVRQVREGLLNGASVCQIEGKRTVYQSCPSLPKDRRPAHSCTKHAVLTPNRSHFCGKVQSNTMLSILTVSQ